MADDAAARAIVAGLVERGATLGLAESITGGRLADQVVSVPGASAVFVGSAVTYATAAKARVLGVPTDLLVRRGAVDPEVARAMALGARDMWSTTYAVATTGSAGPDPAPGGSEVPDVPAGVAYVAVAGPGGVGVWRVDAPGGREAVRDAVVAAAWTHLREVLDGD